MSVKQRVKKLETRARPRDFDVSVHICDCMEGNQDRPHREICLNCAAMSDEEYAAYEAKARKSKHATHIIMVRPEEELDRGD